MPTLPDTLVATPQTGHQKGSLTVNLEKCPRVRVKMSEQYLSVARLIAAQHQLTAVQGQGAVTIHLSGRTDPQLIVTAGVQVNGRVSLEVQHVSSDHSDTPVVLNPIDDRGWIDQDWTGDLHRIIADYAGYLR